MTVFLKKPGRLLACALLLPIFAAVAGPAGPVSWGSTVTLGGGWGRMTRLTNGHWLCVTTRYPAGTNSYLRIHRSTNDGRNWSTLSEVAEDGRTLDNGELIVLPNGTVLLTMRSLIPDLSYRLPVYASTNQGATWTWRSNIDSSENNGAKGLWEPDFWVLDDGRLVVTYSNEKHPGYSQLISERVSDDQGFTWSAELWAVAQPGGGSLRPGMSQMARMANGRYILVYEIVNSGSADVHYKISDNGVTWPTGLGTRIPCHHCGPFIASLTNGLLLVSSCENQVSFSEDYGETWQKIDPPAWNLGYYFSWPAIYQTRSNEVAVMVVTNGVRLRFGTVSAPPRWPNPFTDNFDTGADAGWARYGGNFAFESGAYVLNNEGTYGKALTGDNFWSAGVLEADVMLTSPGNAGLLFRATNPDYTGPDDLSGYYVGLDTSGMVILGRMNNAWTALTNRPVAVPTNTWHRLKVAFQGSTISVFVNDLQMPRFVRNDSTFARGQIGVRAFQCDARFDNLVFSNTAPLRLTVSGNHSQLNFSWPESSVLLKLHAASNLLTGSPLTNLPVKNQRTWNLTLEPPPAPLQFYWLGAP